MAGRVTHQISRVLKACDVLPGDLTRIANSVVSPLTPHPARQ